MRKKQFLAIGECMVELSAAEGDLLRQSFAGDVVNTTWYARAGLSDDWETRFYSGLGTDPMSQSMISFLGAAGISCEDVLRVPDRRPGLYMIHLDGAERSFSYWRETSAARLLGSDRDRLQRVIDSAEIIYFSGITLGIMPEDDIDFLLSALERARDAGKTVAFDPNIRPKLWDGAPRMRNTITRAAQVSSIVLPSFDDEVMAFGDASPHDTAKRYLAGGAKIVVVKNGADDVLVATRDGETILPTPVVDAPVDTTGAGDSFNGGFLAHFIQNHDVEAAVTAGQSVSGRVICQHGALITLAES